MARRCRVQSGKNKGRFTKCGGGGVKRRKRAKKSSARKGRCLRWSKGRKRCIKRA